MRQPGIEPGPTAWKAAILTFRLLSQLSILFFFKVYNLIFIQFYLFTSFDLKKKIFNSEKLNIIYLFINLIK